MKQFDDDIRLQKEVHQFTLEILKGIRCQYVNNLNRELLNCIEMMNSYGLPLGWDKKALAVYGYDYDWLIGHIELLNIELASVIAILNFQKRSRSGLFDKRIGQAIDKQKEKDKQEYIAGRGHVQSIIAHQADGRRRGRL